MDLHQLRCFVAAAEELHFGRAAHRLEMMPSALGRYVRLLEDDLGTRLMTRTTRSVTLTDDGAVLLKEARALLAQADSLAARFHASGRKQGTTIRVGAIDSAAAGLLPVLLHDFRERRPDVTVKLTEDKTIRLLPRLHLGPARHCPGASSGKAATSGSNFCFSCTRPRSSPSPIAIRSHRENGSPLPISQNSR